MGEFNGVRFLFRGIYRIGSPSGGESGGTARNARPGSFRGTVRPRMPRAAKKCRDGATRNVPTATVILGFGNLLKQPTIVGGTVTP
jgi:hypothetical protein